MNLLFRVLFASGCRNTHHKLAMDALRHLRGADAERWQKLFLKLHTEYLDGSKAPDTIFKDFKNHVLHVRENYWGGADEGRPQVVRQYRGRAQTRELAASCLCRRRGEPLLQRPDSAVPHWPIGGGEQHSSGCGVEHRPVVRRHPRDSRRRDRPARDGVSRRRRLARADGDFRGRCRQSVL